MPVICTGSLEEVSERAERIANKWGTAVLSQKKKQWRRNPPTAGQAKFAGNLGLNIAGMNSGQVAEAITYKLAISQLDRKGMINKETGKPI